MRSKHTRLLLSFFCFSIKPSCLCAWHVCLNIFIGYFSRSAYTYTPTYMGKVFLIRFKNCACKSNKFLFIEAYASLNSMVLSVLLYKYMNERCMDLYSVLFIDCERRPCVFCCWCWTSLALVSSYFFVIEAWHIFVGLMIRLLLCDYGMPFK